MLIDPPTASYLGIRFDNKTYDEMAEKIGNLAAAENFTFVVTSNVDHAVSLYNEENLLITEAFRDAYRAAELRVCDSRILQLLARLEGTHLHVTTGSDLISFLFQGPHLNGKTVALIGGQDDTVPLLKKQFPEVTIRQHVPPMGVLHNENALQEIVDYVTQSRCDYVFFAIGSPQSEIAAHRCFADGGARGVGLCVGAAIEFLLGQKARAPRWVQAIRMEWAFRLMSEPKRLWKRYFLGAIKITKLVLKHRNKPANLILH